jgi:two-component system sensor kinase FixL
LAHPAATTFVALGILHELSQPICAAAAFIVASQHFLNSDCTERQTLAQTLESASQELKRARDILMRLRRAVLDIGNERLPINLAELVNTVVGQLSSEAVRRNIHIRVELESLPTVMANALQIRQVLFNLVNNAVDAAAEITNGTVSLRGFHDSAIVEVQVEDNGKGISTEIADHVFEPFQTTKESGMGLGLPLSRQIVEAHGGQLWWEPVSPHGTRFHLRFPLDRSTGYGS